MAHKLEVDYRVVIHIICTHVATYQRPKVSAEELNLWIDLHLEEKCK